MSRRKRRPNMTPELDLHGVKHADVEIMVEDFVLLKTPPVKIITGNSNPMKEIVRKVLKKHDYKFFDGELSKPYIIVLSE